MANCPIAIMRGKGRRAYRDVCGGRGISRGGEIIQAEMVYRVFECQKCGNRFAADPRSMTEADKRSVAYAVADN